MIITAAYENGQPIAPKNITAQSVTVFQNGATEHLVTRGGESGEILYRDSDIELAWVVARSMSEAN